MPHSGEFQIQRQNPFIAPVLLNGWVNFGDPYSPPGYWKDSEGVVHVRGTIKNGTINNPFFVFLPGYRPAYTMVFSTVSNDVLAEIRIDASGNILATVGSPIWLTIDGIDFTAA